MAGLSGIVVAGSVGAVLNAGLLREREDAVGLEPLHSGRRPAEAPLVAVLFAFFAAGALFGILALLGTVLRQRREISLLKKKTPVEQATLPPPGL